MTTKTLKNTNFCNNCGRVGHLFHQCKNPITSIGIICFRKNNDKLEYLLIKRKDSLGYVDFMRGKYPIFNKDYIINLLSEMTYDECMKIKNRDFDELWNELWGEYVGTQYRNEEKISKEKFKLLKSGITINNINYDLSNLIDEISNNYKEPEWGFPKGRRNYQEKDYNCAMREFEEETGYNKNDIYLLQNIIPLEEIFTGSNYKSYKHKYYLGYLDISNKPKFDFQESEVSEVKWFSYEECLERIRPYNLEKKDILKKVDNILKKYTLYT